MQRFLKSSAEQHAKNKAKREEAKAQQLEAQTKLAAIRKDDPTKWKEGIQAELKLLNSKLAKRKKHRQELNDRGSVAYRRRQKLINDAANEGSVDDDFGAKDEDWLVYNEMAYGRDGVDEEEEEDEARIAELEGLLAEHDPSSLYLSYDEQARLYQIQLGVVRARAPECLFQPSMIGIEQAGVAEALQCVLSCYSPEVQQQMCQSVFLTGGCLYIKNIEERLREEIVSIRPADSPFRLVSAKEPLVDAWHGARQWCQQDGFEQGFVSRSEYNERGGDYLKEHAASNVWLGRPKKKRKHP